MGAGYIAPNLDARGLPGCGILDLTRRLPFERIPPGKLRGLR